MRILITGICGFVGSRIAQTIRENLSGSTIFGIDNFSRTGAYLNKSLLESLGIQVFSGDIRLSSDVDALPPADWVIDAAANPSVLAGLQGSTGPRQLLEHNLQSTINILEYCRKSSAGFLLISTSRVYSVSALANIPVESTGDAFVLKQGKKLAGGLTESGINEAFSTQAPVSLYGSTKIASETIALEYGEAFDLPVWVNRCGVLAGAGQFGRPDQGIISFWINSWLRKRPLKYIRFSGSGLQVRDCFHPRDLAQIILKQMQYSGTDRPRMVNLGGGLDNSFSLKQLSDWCASTICEQGVAPSNDERPYDAPWIVMDSAVASEHWDWKAETSLDAIFAETLDHAKANTDWLKISGVD